MNLKKLVAVSRLPGLYRMVANRSNGLIVESISDGKRRFVSARKHQFTPLESIAIYTNDGDSIELKNVFRSMLEQMEDNPPVAADAPPQDLHEYFKDVLPTYDPDRVFTGDIKKVVKWFNFLHQHDLLEDTDKDTSEEE